MYNITFKSVCCLNNIESGLKLQLKLAEYKAILFLDVSLNKLGRIIP